MIYRDERRTIEGVWNKENTFTANRHVQIHADSLDDLFQWLRDTPKKWSADASRGNCASNSWDLDVGYDGACQLAKDGWHEGVERLYAGLQAIIPAVGREARWGYAQQGSSVNIGRYLKGHPKNMRSKNKKQMGSAPVLHIAVNTAASCMITAEQMVNYGVAIVGLIDRLENTGKRVHLEVVNVGCYRGNTRGAYGWTVKRASEPVDLSAVAFSIGHPAAFRRLGFAMMERMPKDFETSGYGFCADIQECDLIDPISGALLLDGVNHEPSRCNTEVDALRLAIEQINKAAVLAGHATPDAPMIDDADWIFEDVIS